MKYLFLFSLVLFYCTVDGQKKGQVLIDSLVKELPASKDDSNKVKLLVRIAQTYMLVNPREGFPYAENGLKLAEGINWKPGIANLHNTLGLMIGDTGNNSLAREHFEQSYALNKELHSLINQVNNLNNIGRAYKRESDYLNATEYFFKALAIAEELKNPEKIALVATNITSIFYTQSDYTKAYEYAEMALKNGESAKAPDQVGKALMLIGIIKVAQTDSAAGKAYLAKALQVYEDMNNKPAMAQVLANMAELERPDLKKQMEIMLKAKAIYDETGPASIGSIGNLANLGKACYDLALQSKSPEKEALLKKSEEYLLRGKELSAQTENAEYSSVISMSLATLEEVKGNYKAALDYYKAYHTINDSLFSQEKKNEIAGLEGKHNIALKDSEIAINKLTLQNQQRTQVGLIIGLLLAAAIVGLLYWQGRNRKKTNTTLMVLNNQLDEANKVKARFFGILSHDLRSPVANLINFLHLQKNEPELLSKTQEVVHQQKISESAEDLLNTMESMLLWSKQQMDNFTPAIKTVTVSSLFDYIQKFFGQSEGLEIRFNQAPGLVVSADENYLQVIMQNLTSNAIKATKDISHPMIEWNAEKKGDKTILSITDNGPGINEDQAKALYEENAGLDARGGFGLHLVRDLAKAIRYKISIQSQPGVGTTFTLIS